MAAVLKKAAISLLIAGVFAVVTHSSLFDMVGTQSYNPTAGTILFVVTFLTAFLTVFFILNIRQDPLVVVKSRMKRLQISLLQQYYESDANIELNRWKWVLQQRKAQIAEQLKKGLGITSPEDAKHIDDSIENSWNELVSVIYDSKDAGIDEEKLQAVLSRFADAIQKEAPGLSPTENQISNSLSNATTVTEVVEVLEEIAAAEEFEEKKIENPK